jgi:hypothetical protein
MRKTILLSGLYWIAGGSCHHWSELKRSIKHMAMDSWGGSHHNLHVVVTAPASNPTNKSRIVESMFTFGSLEKVHPNLPNAEI